METMNNMMKNKWNGEKNILIKQWEITKQL